jgi:hypothetical protein
VLASQEGVGKVFREGSPAWTHCLNANTATVKCYNHTVKCHRTVQQHGAGLSCANEHLPWLLVTFHKTLGNFHSTQPAQAEQYPTLEGQWLSAASTSCERNAKSVHRCCGRGRTLGRGFHASGQPAYLLRGRSALQVVRRHRREAHIWLRHRDHAVRRQRCESQARQNAVRYVPLHRQAERVPGGGFLRPQPRHLFRQLPRLPGVQLCESLPATRGSSDAEY